MTAECPDEAALLAFVDGRANGDDRVQLHEHVEACASCFALVAHMLRGSDPAPPAPVDPDIARGATMGRYMVLDLVGRGGMGVIYSAYDPELDRKVALKVLRPRRAAGGDETVEQLETRLRREAQAMAQLSHPHVVTVFDVGVADGRVFVAMELVEGTTLGAWLRDAPSPDDVVARFVAAGRGLAAAHAAGFVHRDFKPENVLIGRDGVVRVTDFGLVRSVDVPASDGAAPFAASAVGGRRVVGTPAYMAPEQLRGEAADTRADQFSFCVALYEALWRKPPFSGRDLPSLLRAIEAGAPRRPPSRAVPPRVTRALLRGVSARPEDRWPSMDALLVELSAPPRRPVRTAAMALVLACAPMVLGAVAYRWATRAGPCAGVDSGVADAWSAARRLAVHRLVRAAAGEHTASLIIGRLDDYARGWAQMQTDSCQATRVRRQQSEELNDLRTQCLRRRLDELRAVADVLGAPGGARQPTETLRTLTPLAACADILSLRARVPLPTSPPLRAQVQAYELQLTQLDARHRAELPETAADRALLAAASQSAAARAYPPLAAALLQRQAESLVGAGRTDEAVQVLKRSATLALQAGADETAFAAWNLLAYAIGYAREQADEALDWSDLAGAISARLVGRDDLEVLRLTTRAQIDDVTNRVDDEEATLARAVPLAEKVLVASSPVLTELCSMQASVLSQRKQLDAAALAYRRCIADEIAARGDQTTRLATLQQNLALVLEDLRRFDEALALLARSITLHEQDHPADHPFIVGAKISMGEIYFFKGDDERARTLLQAALSQAAARPDMKAETAQARSLLAKIAARSKRGG